MNWVGGSRTRVLIKQERRKQKEYFEKKRLKSKMKLWGVLSPVKNSDVSLDLLNLYMVNQISCQKKKPVYTIKDKAARKNLAQLSSVMLIILINSVISKLNKNQDAFSQMHHSVII
nr:uncharacterized protein C12orf40 homolog [Equus asinus]